MWTSFIFLSIPDLLFGSSCHVYTAVRNSWVAFGVTDSVSYTKNCRKVEMVRPAVIFFPREKHPN